MPNDWIEGAGVFVSVLSAFLSYHSSKKAEASKLEAGELSAEATRVSAAIGARAETKTNDKTVFVGSVTAERATWRREMRVSTSSVVEILRASDTGDNVSWMPIFRCVSEIALRLNPDGRSEEPDRRDAQPLDRDIHAILVEIVGSSREQRAVHNDMANRLEAAVALLLKEEWRKSKSEATNGHLQ